MQIVAREISPKLHKDFKIKCAAENVRMGAVIINLIEKYVDGEIKIKEV